LVTISITSSMVVGQ
jgi:hypothetical protein